jgi:hypothetical protein
MRSIPIRLSMLAALAILALAAPPVAQGRPPDDEETLGPAEDAVAWLAGHGFTVQDPTVVDGVRVIVASRLGEATGEGESLARLIGDPDNLAGMSLEMDLASALSAELLVRWLERFAPDAMTHVVAMLGAAGEVGGSFTDIDGPPVVAHKGATGVTATHMRIEVGDMAPAPVAATPQPTPATVTGGPAAIEVVDQGFTQQETYAMYAVVLRNPNPAWSVTSVPVDVAFLDADGGILDVATSYLSMDPDQTSAVSGQVLVEDAKTSRSLSPRATTTGRLPPARPARSMSPR